MPFHLRSQFNLPVLHRGIAGTHVPLVGNRCGGGFICLLFTYRYNSNVMYTVSHRTSDSPRKMEKIEAKFIIHVRASMVGAFCFSFESCVNYHGPDLY